jgi:predicted RNA-binding Zn ribbon-like protein
VTDNWVWDGGRPCLDFVNTRRDRWTHGWELLQAPADLVEWLREAGLAVHQVTERELAFAIDLREAIDRAAQADTPASGDVELINRWARERPAPQLRVTREGARQATTEPTVATALGTLAVDAIGLLTSEDEENVRVCALDSCGLRFVDRSPAHNRQWCSMSRCGNRAKARQHYARRRANAQVEDNRPRE